VGKYLFLDIESTGLRFFKDKLYCVAWAIDSGEIKVERAGNISAEFREAFSNPVLIKIGHNTRFDLKFLISNGLELQGQFYDTMLLALLLDENRPLGLKPLSRIELGEDSTRAKNDLDECLAAMKFQHVGQLCAFDLALEESPYYPLIAEYNAEDVRNDRDLFYKFKSQIEKLHLEMNQKGYKQTPLTYYLNEMVPAEAVLLDLELRGVRVDPDAIEKLRVETETRQAAYMTSLNELTAKYRSAIEDQLYLEAVASFSSPKKIMSIQKQSEKDGTAFNWASGPQVARLFYGCYNVPERLIPKTKGGKPSIKEELLAEVGDKLHEDHSLRPVLEVFGAYKKTVKTLNTYVGTDTKGILSHVTANTTNGLPWVYPNYKHMTEFGRFSVTDPNMNNIPRESAVKKYYIPENDDEVFIYCDFKQIQLKIAADLSQDPVLLNEYHKPDPDLHKQTAAKMFRIPETAVEKQQRQAAKTANFAMIFDAQPGTLLQQFKLKNGLEYTYQECKVFKDEIFRHWARYRQYLDQQLELVIKNKQIVATNGRIRRLPDISYGKFLDFRNKTFSGSLAMVEALKKNPEERLTDEDIFVRAKLRYSHAKNQAFCAPIQGLEATIEKAALVNLKQAGFRIVGTVYDSAVALEKKDRVHERAAEMKHIMESSYRLSVPITVDQKILTSFSEEDLFL
jgi:DNA polymerase-1